MQPTKEQFVTYNDLYNHLNNELFEGKLNPCLLTMIPNRSANGGHFWAEKWSKDDQTVHEISMNPQGYAIDDPKFFVSILVHEMVHLWCHDNGQAARKGYHCKKWGTKMKEVGLYPSDTGHNGGKETGQQMSHYIIEGGAFDTVYDLMPKDLMLPFKRASNPMASASKKRSKLKYSCENCATNIWGKPGLRIKCFQEDCNCYMESE